MKRFSALALTLLVSACPGGGGSTTATTDDTGSTGSTGSPATTTTTTTADPTTTTSPSSTDPSTSTTEPAGSSSTDPGTTTDPSTGSSSTDASTSSTGSSTDASTGSTGMPVEAVCGDGVAEGDEACDDGNVMTELSKSNAPPLMYDPAQCIDDCSLVLSKCGNKVVDPGEQCDDGNTDSTDACTTSCLTNDKAVHSPCKRTCNNCDTDIANGTIMGCDNLQVPNGAQKICFDSSQSILAKRYFAEGECLAAAQQCTGGGLCPPNVGDVTKLMTCPNGTSLVTNVTMALNLKITTKVCHKTCDSDADCRWNAYDAVWKKPGQYRCQTTPDSNGVKICADAQNN